MEAEKLSPFGQALFDIMAQPLIDYTTAILKEPPSGLDNIIIDDESTGEK